MSRNPYHRFRGQRLTLNDYLSIDRTVLANERTLLAYGRTALALAAVGGSCIKFFDAAWVGVAGVCFIFAGAIVAVWGGRRYVHTRRSLSAALEQETGTTEHPFAEDVSSSKETAASREE